MRNGMIAVALAGWMGGCGGPGGGFEGIWMVSMSPLVEAEPTFVIEHNFSDAVEPPSGTTPGPWTYENSGEQSDSLMLVEIFGLKGKGEDEAILVLEGAIYPGRETDEKGTWEFVWEGHDDNEITEAHVDGYRLTESGASSAIQTIRLTIDGRSATGTFSIGIDVQDAYTESDSWDPMETYLQFSQVPSSSYVFDASGMGISNSPTETECVSDPCSLSVSTSFSASGDFTAAWTRYSDAGAFDGVDSAGQPFGTGLDPYDDYDYDYP